MTGERGDARKRNLTVVPCCDAAAAVARVEAALRDAIDELVECRSFIAVETRHYPTVQAINEKVADLRAALDGPADGGAM